MWLLYRDPRSTASGRVAQGRTRRWRPTSWSCSRVPSCWLKLHSSASCSSCWATKPTRMFSSRQGPLYAHILMIFSAVVFTCNCLMMSHGQGQRGSVVPPCDTPRHKLSSIGAGFIFSLGPIQYISFMKSSIHLFCSCSVTLHSQNTVAAG